MSAINGSNSGSVLPQTISMDCDALAQAIEEVESGMYKSGARPLPPLVKQEIDLVAPDTEMETSELPTPAAFLASQKGNVVYPS